MKFFFAIFAVATAGVTIVPGQAQVNVTQEHNHISRDGLYNDSAFTRTAAANLRRDLNFNGPILGRGYAQPLYIENGPRGGAMNNVATEKKDKVAPQPGTSKLVLHPNDRAAVASPLPCGHMNPPRVNR